MKLLIAYLIFAVGAFSLVSIANAEEQKDFNVKVPFDYQNSGCTLVIDTPEYKKYDCTATWKSSDFKYDDEITAPSEDGCISGMDIDIETGECRPFGEIAEEAKEEYFKNLAIEELEKDDDPRLPDVDSEKASDKELVKKINNILASEDPRCYQGFGTTAGVQNVRDFSIPVHTITRDGKTFVELDTSVPTGAMDYTGLLKEILTHGQECKAQMILNNIQGGVLSSQDYQSGYCDVHSKDLTIEESVQAGCGMSSGAFLRDLKATVPEWSQSRINQEGNFGLDMANNRYDIVEDVCEGFYTNTYKMTFKECRDIRDAKVELSGGHVPELKDYGHDLEIAVNLYKEDGGASMAEDLRKQIIQEKISQLMKQLQTLRDSQE